MKAVFIGGGSMRIPSTVRGALAQPGIFSDGEIRLVDLAVDRARDVASLLAACPELQGTGCKIVVEPDLDRALEGADVVNVVIMPGSQEHHARSMVATLDHGFLASDNISLSGSALGVKAANVLLGFARRMERYCPNAMLLNFANPTAVVSAAVNNHTKIQAMGVCGGATNHRWDLSRLLGKDEFGEGFDVTAAGVNHCAFITAGTHHGRDLFAVLDEAFAGDWRPPRLQDRWAPGFQAHMDKNLTRLKRLYQELGLLIFSSENDGISHLYYEEALAERPPVGDLTLEERVRKCMRITPEGRARMEQQVRDAIAAANDPAFWADQDANHGPFARSDSHIFVQILRGIAGPDPVKVVTSRPNGNAIAGIKPRTVVEYSQIVAGATITPVPGLEVPNVAHGMVSALAAHQTMIGDAVATGDPKLLAQAFLAYPIRPYSQTLRDLFTELVAINRDEFPEPLKHSEQYV